MITKLDLGKRQFRILFRQFLFRMVDVELLSSAAQGDISKLLGRFAAILVFVGLWLGLGVILTAGAARGGAAGLLLIWAEEHFLIATTLLAVGLFAVISWDSIFPDRREVTVLAPLPVHARTFLLAKVAAVAGALGLAVGVLNALTGLAVPLSFYLGLAFAIVILGSKEPTLQARAVGEGLQPANLIILISSVLVMCAAIAGVRITFSMPLDLRANWVFRIMPLRGGADHLRATRRSLYALSLAPVWLVTAAVLAWMWPWKQAVAHLAVLGLFGAIIIELLLLNFRKIPFTCSYLPGKSNMIVILVVSVMLGFSALINAINFEMRALMEDHRSLWRMLAVLAGAACALRLCAWWRTRAESEAIEFEDVPEPEVMALGLNRDGSAIQG